ncbi:MAG: hypothetical protein DLM73_09420 [Chthoniobacterales bacterium]|nr:MAG: hypothetical protein DLM73_09420 [Chthoniobacterales bacterium]
MPTPKTVLQIVPYLPGTLDGVGDYALNLAKALAADHGLTTLFAVARGASINNKDGFSVISSLDECSIEALAEKCEHVILHYANYGYQSRGIPFHLRSFARQLRGQLRGRWLTTFHELYASGPPWKSAFWLHPLQVKIARDLIDLSTSCFVSNSAIEKAIHVCDPRKPVHLAPVMSNFGEPNGVDDVSPKRWAICGGTALIARSLALFEQRHRSIPDHFSPDHLDVIGGRDENSTRVVLERLSRNTPGLSCHYHPEVSAELASGLLRKSSFGWIDYFGTGKMWPGMILKSGAFAAYCAHGVVPVLSHREEAIAIEGDALPGPYFITGDAVDFPSPDRLRETRQKIHAWYQAHAASRQIARIYAEALTK